MQVSESMDEARRPPANWRIEPKVLNRLDMPLSPVHRPVFLFVRDFSYWARNSPRSKYVSRIGRTVNSGARQENADAGIEKASLRAGHVLSLTAHARFQLRLRRCSFRLQSTFLCGSSTATWFWPSAY